MRIWKFLFTSNGVFKQKEVVSNLHVPTNDLEKCALYIYFTFYKNSNPHTYETI